MERVAKFYKVGKEQFLGDCSGNHWFLSDDSYDELKLPKRATSGSAGYDFFSPMEIRLKPGKTVLIPTGIRCEMKESYALYLFPKSGLGFKYQIGLCNTLGVVDSDFAFSDNEGHIMVKLVNRGDREVIIHKGDKFCQGIFLPFGITEDDECTGVRNGGFGSTGK